MDLFFNTLKGQVNTLNILILFFALPVVAGLLRRTRLARIALGIAVLMFFLASTEYVPHYLIGRMESGYSPFERSAVDSDAGEVFIHVLGGGYTFDERLPALGKLSQISLGRLAEGVRIAHQLPNSTLVFSGGRVSGSESMASVMKQAAMSFGIDARRINVLEEPRTTEEEASTFVRRYGKDVKMIVVTDAIHMRRALDFFKQYDMAPHPAPTNYLVKQSSNQYKLRWMPSSINLLLMDRVLREWLGTLKGKIT